MAENILSVKTNTLIEKAWNLLTDDGDNLDEILEIYNELCRCINEIGKCDSESEYSQLESRVSNCEKAILKFAV